MQLEPEQIEELEQLAGCNYSPEKIALYLGVDKNEFLQEWNDPESQIRYHYDRGVLLIQAKADMSLSKSASEGNITAHQQYLKNQYFQRLDNFKLKMKLDSDLKDINNLQQYLATGDLDLIPAGLELQYEILDFARRMYVKYENKEVIYKSLQKSFPDQIRGRRKAAEVFAMALNFFYLDNEVKPQAWANVIADKLENAASLALEMNELENYRRLMHDVATLRGCFKEAKETIPEEMYRKQFVLYAFDPKLFNLKRVDRKLVKDYINNLPDLKEEDLKQLHRDNMSEDVEFELIDTPDDEN